MNNNTYYQSPEQKSCQYMRKSDTVSAFPEKAALAMAYVPFQQFGEVYASEKALSQGTIFPCLDKPFMMGCCKC